MTAQTQLLERKAATIDYVRRAIELAPRIEDAALRIDKECQLPAELFVALNDAGLYRLLLPECFNGAELPPPTFVEVIEAIAKADASTAWCIAQTSVCSMSAAYLAPDVARAIFGNDPRAVLAWGPPSRSAKAVAVQGGGYRVSGTWMFASGGRQANWLAGHCSLYNADGTQRLAPDGRPVERSMLFRKTDATMTDVWDVVGLRGTGSDNYSVSDLFVPEDHTFLRDGEGDRRHPGALYRVSMFHMFAVSFAGVALGIARATLDAFIALAAKKTPMLRQAVLRDNAAIQSQVGHCQARLLSARAFLLQSIGSMWDGAVAADITIDQRAAMRMASTHAIHEAKDVIETVYHAAGATAIFSGNPFERRMRDIHAVTQQIQGHFSLFEIVGQHLLGLSPNFKLL